MVKYSYYIARISSFIASKMQSSVTKNLVFPSCGDIKILQLLVCMTAFIMLYDILAVPCSVPKQRSGIVGLRRCTRSPH